MQADRDHAVVKNEGRDARHATQSSTARAIAPPSYGVELVDQQTGTSQPIQLKRSGDASSAEIQRAARAGIRTHATALPYAAAIQQSFGRHDISGIRFHDGAEAAMSARAMRAQAYCMGAHVVSAGPISKHTAAHEAAHYIQQQGGVQLQSHVGSTGDRYERHADAVASAVVQGRSAEALLDGFAPSSDAVSTSATTDVQMARPEPDDKHEGLTAIAQAVGGPDGVAYSGQVYVRQFGHPSPAMIVRGAWADRLAEQNNVNVNDIMIKPTLEPDLETDVKARGLLAHEVAHWARNCQDHPLALYQHETASARGDSDANLKAYLNHQFKGAGNTNYGIMAKQITKSEAATEFLKQMKAIADGE